MMRSPSKKLGMGKEGALYNPNYIDPSRLSVDAESDKIAGIATNYGLATMAAPP